MWSSTFFDIINITIDLEAEGQFIHHQLNHNNVIFKFFWEQKDHCWLGSRRTGMYLVWVVCATFTRNSIGISGLPISCIFKRYWTRSSSSYPESTPCGPRFLLPRFPYKWPLRGVTRMPTNLANVAIFSPLSTTSIANHKDSLVQLPYALLVCYCSLLVSSRAGRGT